MRESWLVLPVWPAALTSAIMEWSQPGSGLLKSLESRRQMVGLKTHTITLSFLRSLINLRHSHVDVCENKIACLNDLSRTGRGSRVKSHFFMPTLPVAVLVASALCSAAPLKVRASFIDTANMLRVPGGSSVPLMAASTMATKLPCRHMARAPYTQSRHMSKC